MVEIGAYRTPGIALDVAVAGNYVYLSTGLEGDITVVDHANSTGMVSESFYRTPNKTTKVTVSADRLYSYGDDASLEVFDRTNPGQLVDLGAIQLTRNAQSIVSQATLTFVGDGSGELHIFDATLAGIPKQVDALSALGGIEGMAVTGNSLLLAIGAKGMLYLALGDAMQATTIRAFSVPGYVQSLAATTGLGYVLTSEGTLFVVDFSHPTTIHIVGHLDLDAKAQAIAVQDGIAYIAAGEAGLYIVDLTQPTQPKLIAVYDTPGVALHVAATANKIFVADGYAGLLVLTLSSKREFLDAVKNFAQ
jgi:hypothetical protein